MVKINSRMSEKRRDILNDARVREVYAPTFDAPRTVNNIS